MHALNLDWIQECEPGGLEQRAEDVISDDLHSLELLVSCCLEIWDAELVTISDSLGGEVLTCEREVLVRHKSQPLQFMDAIHTILVQRYELLRPRGHAVDSVLGACWAKVDYF